MTETQILQTVKKYDAVLATKFEVQRHPTHAVAPSGEQALRHVRWMCAQVQTFVAEGKLEKANRWLGFIQGALWSLGRGSVDAFREDNRDASSSPEG